MNWQKYSSVIILIIMLLLLDASTLTAQRRQPESQGGVGMSAYRLEVTPFWGYQMGGKSKYSGGSFNIIDSQVYGLHVGSPTPIGAILEFLYSHQPTRLEGQVSTAFEPTRTQDLFNMNVNYYMLGLLRPLVPGPKQPFGVVYLGAANLKPTDPGYTDEWMFAIGLGGGLKARLHPRFGIRLQGRLMMPMQFSGGGLWCGTGGCDIGVGSSSTILQFDVNAGLVIYL